MGKKLLVVLWPEKISQ